MMSKKMLFCAVLLAMATCVQAGLDATPIVNGSFEDPDLADGVSEKIVTDWFDSVAYTFTTDDASDNHPDTPYGENWGELGNQRWMYQQIGTYEENMDLNITFLLGQRGDKPFQGVHVSLLVGGTPASATDVNLKYYSENPLVTQVGAVEIANSGVIDPFVPSIDMATSEQSLSFSTGTGFTVGDPLWIQINKVDGTGRVLIDNVAVALVPEPATMALLAIGSIAALRRRRK